MMRLEEPMTTFSDDEWRAYKGISRARRHQQRMAAELPADVERRIAAWLQAVYRDDRTDPAMVESTNFVEVAEQASV